MEPLRLLSQKAMEDEGVPWVVKPRTTRPLARKTTSGLPGTHSPRLASCYWGGYRQMPGARARA